MKDTIYSLNGGQHARQIHFFADGSGHGIRWELASTTARPPLNRKGGEK